MSGPLTLDAIVDWLVARTDYGWTEVECQEGVLESRPFGPGYKAETQPMDCGSGWIKAGVRRPYDYFLHNQECFKDIAAAKAHAERALVEWILGEAGLGDEPATNDEKDDDA